MSGPPNTNDGSNGSNAGNGDPPDANAGPPAPPPTPLDHPLFLPILLFAGCIWFGYDGFLNTDPDMLEHRTFNQVGFAALVLAFLWWGRKGIAEFREDQQRKDASDGQPR